MLEHDFFKHISKNLIKKYFFNVFQARQEDSHKGTFGSLVILGGSRGMEGALVLAGQSALKMGCGKVFVSFIQQEYQFSYINLCPEIMLIDYTDCLHDQLALQAVVIGCGLGSSLLAQRILQNSINHFSIPTVLDADALNILATRRFIFNLSLKQHILTPHPGEAARLLHCSVKDIQKDRIDSAQKIAHQYNANVVLKGPHTVVYTPLDGCLYVNETGNHGLATAGTGDVLSGIIGSLLAQGYQISEAVRAGVFLHGLAADWLVSQHIGPIGLTASEVIEAARYVRNQITYYSQ